MNKNLLELKKSWYSLSAIYSKAAKKLGVNAFEFKVLHLIFVGHGELTQKELVSYTNEVKQIVHNAVNKLKREGLIELIINEKDRRTKFIQLTKKGLKVWDEKFDKVIKAEDKTLRRFSDDEIESAISFLKQYSEYLEETIGNIKYEQ